MKRTGIGLTVNIVLLIIGACVILYFGSKFLIPLAFAGILAMLFYPLEEKLEKKGVPRGGAIAICMLILFITGGVFFAVVGYQANYLSEEWPSIKQQLQEKQKKLEYSLVENSRLLSRERLDEIKKNIAQDSSSIQSRLKEFLGSFINILTNCLLVSIYFIFIMLEHQRFENFIIRLSPEKETANEIMTSSRKVASNYVVGRMILILILSILYSVGFLTFGLKNAIPIAILTAMFSLIPFIGNIIGGSIAVLVALATGGGLPLILGVAGTMAVAQFLESYVLQPWIVGTQVSLNPFFTLAAVVGFSFLWGVSGTVLAIPVVAIMKQIFNKIEPLKPYGYVLGNGK